MSTNTEYGATRDSGYRADVNMAESPPASSKPDSKAEHEKDDHDAEFYGLGQQTTLQEGELKYHRLSWQRLTVCLIVEAIALGSLSIPSAFATLGMVPGVLLSVGLGFIAIYTSYVVGQVKLRHPHVADYADAVGLIWGRFGYELTSVMFILLLVLLFGSHTLTGAIAWINIVDKPGICALVWSIISAILLFLLALPPSFTEFAILGYIDFVSICTAILITIIATGVEASHKPGGLSAVDWSLWPAPGTSFYDAFLSVTNIVFAYSFAVCQFSFMTEMHTPKDYVKSIWALGMAEMVIYTVTGALVYAFVGSGVQSPALLSSSHIIVRVAFGVALPVIFISGSINGTVCARYIVNRAFRNSQIRYINTPSGWLVWTGIIAVVAIIAWIIAEAVPFFNELLGIMSALFISGFTFYFPALFWFKLVKEGKWYQGWHNISLSILNAIVFIIGLTVLGCGTYASVESIIQEYNKGSVRGAFTCSTSAY